MSYFLKGISPEPCQAIVEATTGLYDSLVVGVYSNTPNLGALSFKSTIVSALKSMGWSPNNPKQGVTLRLIGDQPALDRMNNLLSSIPFIKSFGYLHNHKQSAENFYQLDQELKHLTHLITFHDRQTTVDTSVRDMAKNYCVGVIDVVTDW